MAFSRWEVLWIGKHVWSTDVSTFGITLLKTVIKSLMKNHIFLCIPWGTCMFYLDKSSSWNYNYCRPWRQVPRGLQTSSRLPRKSVSSYFAEYNGEEFAPVTFLAAALSRPILQHMGCLGGCRRAEPLRLPERCWRRDLHGQTAGKDTKHGRNWLKIEESIHAEKETLDLDSGPFRLPGRGCVIAPHQPCAQGGRDAQRVKETLLSQDDLCLHRSHP